MDSRLLRSYGPALLAAASLYALCGDTLPRAVGQVGPNAMPTTPRREGEGLIPPSDPDAEAWLKRAADAAADGEWKLAVDTLSRVIEQFSDRTVSPDGKTFISASAAAQNQFKAWPEAGLSAYRLLFDPIADEQLTQAESKMDVEQLRGIARNYPMTTRAPQAMTLLVTLLIDRREPYEALDILEQVRQLPHNDVPQWKQLQLLAAASALAGATDDAKSSVDRLRRLIDEKKGNLPDDINRRIQSLERLIDSSEVSSNVGAYQGDNATSQHGVDGTELDPAVTQEALWQDVMPGSGRIDSIAITQLLKRTGRPPVWQAATDGSTLFITSPDGLMSRDPATIELLWKSHSRLVERDPRIDAQRQLVRMYDSDNSGRLDEITTRSLYHEYRGTVTTGLGMAYVIEQSGTQNELYPSREGLAPPNDSVEPEANSIRAFEARTGRARWTIGRGGKPNDELRFVHFYSPPVAIGAHLIAPYQSQNDFCLGVFNADGALVRKVLLGSADKTLFPINAVLTPTVDETTIYVPTAAGLLVALNRYDYSLRWLALYDRSRRNTASTARRTMPLGNVQYTFMQPDEWLSTPPLRAGGTVILAPQDGEQLLAFDRRNGELRWSFPRGDHRYLVGAVGRNVIVAGTGLLAIDLENGRGKWSYSKQKLTGRPTINGRHILVPTPLGLETIDAESGTPVGAMKPSSEPLGNLLVFDGALFSIGPKRITKYPDLARSRSAALAQIEKSPDDPGAYVRLAWLEKLNANWIAALNHLDQADRSLKLSKDRGSRDSETAAAARSDLHSRIAHQRVDVLLRLAAESEADPDQAEVMITRAVSSAVLPVDVLSSGLARCDHLADRGRRNEAFEFALDLLLKSGEETISHATDLRVGAPVALHERLERWWNDADTPGRQAMETAVNRVFSEALSDSRINACRRISDTTSFSTGTAERDLAIARRDWAEGSLENAIFHWERAARRTTDGPTSLAALVLLMRAYSDPGPALPRSAADARRIYSLLLKRHHTAVVPDRLYELPASMRGKTVEQLRNACPPRWHVASSQTPRPDILSEAVELGLTDYEVTAAYHPSDVSAFLTEQGLHDPFADMLPIRIMRQVRGVNMQDQAAAEVYWACNLEPTLEPADLRYSSRRTMSLQPSEMAVEGRIAVLRCDQQLLATGLLSGRAAWPLVPIEAETGDLPRPSLVQYDGIILFSSQPDSLIAIPARMDASPIWQRTFETHRLGTLAVVDGQFVAIDHKATTVYVLDPYSGRIRRRFSLIPAVVPDEEEVESDEDIATSERDTSAVLVGPVVCNSAFKTVIGRDIGTGRVLWERSVAGRVKKLLKLSDDALGVCYRGQKIAVIDARSGRVISDLELPGMVLPPGDAVLEGRISASSINMDTNTTKDALIGRDVSGARLTIFTNTDDDPPEYVIASISLDTKKTIWNRNLGRFAVINSGMLRESSTYLPIIVYRISADAPRRLTDEADSQLNVAAFDVLDKSTGRSLLATPFVYDREQSPDEFGRSRLFTDLRVMNNHLIAIAAEGYYVLSKSVGTRRATATESDMQRERETP